MRTRRPAPLLRGHDELSPGQRANLCGPVPARLRPVLARRFARDLLACPAATIDLTAILDGGILIAQLPPDVGHAVDANARNNIYFTVSPEDARHLAATPRRCSRLGLGGPARVPRQHPCPAPRPAAAGVLPRRPPAARPALVVLLRQQRVQLEAPNHEVV
jgi:hypothetical protein